MCNIVPVTERIDHTVRSGWTAGGAAAAPLPPHALRWLAARTGLPPSPVPCSLPAPAVPASTLPEAVAERLREGLGTPNLLTGEEARLGRAGGLSYLDLLRRRTGGDIAVPDAVALPGDHAEVAEVLRICVEHDVAVVPFGGGTSVVGGVTALRGAKRAVLALDTARLSGTVTVDEVSRLATFGAGVTTPEAAALLAPHGLTLGHVPQSYERATLGGFAATHSAGQASSGYGRFADMVAAVRVATPRGEWRLGVAPSSAAGPDLRQLVVGSEGTLGVITEVTVRVRPRPTECRYEGYALDGWPAGVGAVRALAQAGAAADVTRLSDVDETEVSLALTGGAKAAAMRAYLRARGIARPCLLVLGWEATSGTELAARRAATLRALRGHRAARLGRPVGESWRRGRFAGPRQRDALLDAGVAVETLETATYWSRLTALHQAVRTALIGELTVAGRRPVVMCHVSHAYETGASLYFTVLVPRADTDPESQWLRAKQAACEAISGDGTGPLGTISHHHATGTDHAPYLPAEIGSLGVDVLAAAKYALDPTGIMNPGKLLADL